MDKKDITLSDFDHIQLALASPDEISKWSHGEITKPETINYRTQKPERDGLFDERVFGPVKDWECYCGKYKKIRYKGVICDRCGVEVTRSSVRRERMGHMDLVVPVVHIWYIKGGGGAISTLLDISISDVEAVTYFASFVILEVDEKLKEQAALDLQREYDEAKKDPKIKNNPLALKKLEAAFKASKQQLSALQRKKILSESEYYLLSLKFGQIIRVGIGAEAILELLKTIDFDEEVAKISQKLSTQVVANRKKLLKKFKLLRDMDSVGVRPEWLVLTKIPVIPPDLRPMVQLDGGRFAASDLNDLYRRVLNRNNRLKKLIGAGAPEVICRNEKRMLQEAVDALIDNSAKRSKAAVTGGQRKLRSLSDILRGKQGRFRQNLLGKRVDYSGRSVIVIGPDLKLHQCGIPKVMALELFKTFVISRLISQGYVYNVKNASKMIESRDPVVWDILEQITKEHYVLLNRAPTLHRLGIQSFVPILIEGKAIQIHPLVCQAYNADFDGDQMAVHVPLSEKAVFEAKEIMLSAKNLLKPASGEPIVTPRFDMILGSFYLTSLSSAEKTSRIYSSKNEAIMAWQTDNIGLKTRIGVLFDDNIVESDTKIQERAGGRVVETCVGRILFNNLLPDELQFVNKTIDAKAMKAIIARIFKDFGNQATVEMLDKVKTLGFEYATISGLSIGMDDILVPAQKGPIIKEAGAKVEEIEAQLRRGLITPREKSLRVIEIWSKAREEVEGAMVEVFSRQSDNPVYAYVSSGTRGSVAQLTQMAAMKGLVVNPAGEIIEIPITSNYREGLNVFEYFISSHGSRKGRSDTSLRTSDAGYLTRRLVDVAQDVIITEKDCGTTKGLEVIRGESEGFGESFAERLEGRFAPGNIKDGRKTLVKVGEEITKEKAREIEKSAVASVLVRSATACETKYGICQKCYGRDLGTGAIVEMGVAVGIIAAQAIGEPGTQLTMKTFHLGGVTGEDITSGLPRVEELFEARRPKFEAPIAQFDGVARVKKTDGAVVVEVVADQPMVEKIDLPDDYKPAVKNGEQIKEKKAVAVCQDKKAIRATINGVAKVEKRTISIYSKDKMSQSFEINPNMAVLVKGGEKVARGQILSEGHVNLSEALNLQGVSSVIKYITKEIKAIYMSQGQSINDKHLEIIIRQMLSKCRVADEGESDLVPGQIIDKIKLEAINQKLKAKKKKEADGERIVMGITRVALKTDSFLSAASFQETTSVLISAAISGARDHLKGLKENVIIGKLIPAGTGFKSSKKKK